VSLSQTHQEIAGKQAAGLPLKPKMKDDDVVEVAAPVAAMPETAGALVEQR
jgi:hypothetical protein